MKLISQFKVRPKNNRRYDNIKKIGDVNFITSVSEEDHKASNRIAVVIETPHMYSGPIKPGYELIVHHNVFKFYNDMKGNRRSGKSFLFENDFILDDEQWFAFREGEGSEFTAKKGIVFVEPIKESFREGSVIIHDNTNDKISVGTIVNFTPESEYEFRINNFLMYKMRTEDLVSYE